MAPPFLWAKFPLIILSVNSNLPSKLSAYIIPPFKKDQFFVKVDYYILNLP